MPNINAEIVRGLKALENACGLQTGPAASSRTPQTFTWKGAAIPCVPTSTAREIIIDREGNAVEITLRLFVRLSHFVTVDSTLITVDSELLTVDNNTPRPVSGKTLVYFGQIYRIMTARVASVQSHIELTLGDAASNR